LIDLRINHMALEGMLDADAKTAAILALETRLAFAVQE